MIDGLKPYPKMKDSGVPWLGEVPAHWETRPLKRWVRMNRDVLPEATSPEYEFRYLDIGSVGTGVLTARPQRLRFAAAPSRARRVVSDGDTIVSTVRTYLNAVYFVEGNSDELVCSTGFAVLTPTAGTVPKFVSYLCQSRAFTDRVTADSVGIAYPAIAETRLAAFHVAIPPLPEQTAIVRFLDYMDRRIRRYIRAKQKLIKLLEEQKQAIIHRAVTRGLDPKVRLKPSGVEWLGDVPEHWEVRRLKWIAKFNPSRTEQHMCDSREMVPFLPMERVGTDGEIDPELRPYGEVVSGYTYFCKDDVVLAKITPCFENGKGACLEKLPAPFGFGTTEFIVLRARDDVLPQYLYALTTLATFRKLGADAMTGSAGQQRVPLSFVKNFEVPLPSTQEQRAILTCLDGQMEDIDRWAVAAAREIALLREYRTRLIADVVTGKLDVREAAARLPEETDAAEPPDEIEDDTEEAAEAEDVTDSEEMET